MLTFGSPSLITNKHRYLINKSSRQIKDELIRRMKSSRTEIQETQGAALNGPLCKQLKLQLNCLLKSDRLSTWVRVPKALETCKQEIKFFIWIGFKHNVSISNDINITFTLSITKIKSQQFCNAKSYRERMSTLNNSKSTDPVPALSEDFEEDLSDLLRPLRANDRTDVPFRVPHQFSKQQSTLLMQRIKVLFIYLFDKFYLLFLTFII